MQREFSENSMHLLKDSLTLEIPDFPWLFAVPEWGEGASAKRTQLDVHHDGELRQGGTAGCAFALALV
jgi:hypothetical protein